MPITNIFFQPTHKIYSTAECIKEGLRPVYSQMSHSLCVPNIENQVAVQLFGMFKPERYKNFLSLFPFHTSFVRQGRTKFFCCRKENMQVTPR